MQAYLEFSEDGGSGRRFYEARVDGPTLTVRYGRIGTEGQTQVRTFPTPEAAQAEAQKQLAEKRREGYADALPGVQPPYRAVLEATIRPYIRLEGRPGEARPWTSKLGGGPYRPLGHTWPLARDGTPLAFLAQLNFGEFPPLAGFPSRGIVQFFIRDDDYFGANFDGPLGMASLSDDANYRVLYHPEVITDETRLELSPPPFIPAPDGGLPHDPEQEFVLRGELAFGPVTTHDRLFDHLVGQSLWKIADEADYERLTGAGHRLGGYPNFTQQDPRAVEDPHVLLLQLDSDDDLALRWGDMGIANFFIPAQDLARADFSRVAYNWDCT